MVLIINVIKPEIKIQACALQSNLIWIKQNTIQFLMYFNAT